MLVPLRDFIVVAKDDAPKQSPGGIIIASTVAEEKVVTGVVVAAGSGLIAGDGTKVPLEVQVNDRVVFSKSLSVEVKDGDQTFLLLREEHVLCVSR